MEPWSNADRSRMIGRPSSGSVPGLGFFARLKRREILTFFQASLDAHYLLPAATCTMGVRAVRKRCHRTERGRLRAIKLHLRF